MTENIKIESLKIPKDKINNYGIPKMLPQPPSFRALFIGSSNSGKTATLVSLLNTYYHKYFKTRIFFCSTYESNKTYKPLIKKKGDLLYDEYNDETLREIIEYQKEQGAKKKPILLVFDDFTKNEMRQPYFQDQIKFCRHYMVSCCFLVQKYNILPTVIRTNASHLFIFSVSSGHELRTITNDLAFLDKDELEKMYKEKEEAWRKEMERKKTYDVRHPFILINNVTSTMQVI